MKQSKEYSQNLHFDKEFLSEGISLYAIPVFCIIGWLITFAIIINK